MLFTICGPSNLEAAKEEIFGGWAPEFLPALLQKRLCSESHSFNITAREEGKHKGTHKIFAKHLLMSATHSQIIRVNQPQICPIVGKVNEVVNFSEEQFEISNESW